MSTVISERSATRYRRQNLYLYANAQQEKTVCSSAEILAMHLRPTSFSRESAKFTAREYPPLLTYVHPRPTCSSIYPLDHPRSPNFSFPPHSAWSDANSPISHLCPIHAAFFPFSTLNAHSPRGGTSIALITRCIDCNQDSIILLGCSFTRKKRFC